MDKASKIFVAGHGGLVGSAIVRKLKAEGYLNLITKTRSELDLCSQSATQGFFQSQRPDYVFLAAAKVGGIKANIDFPADFLYQNLTIQTNVIKAAFDNGVKKFLFLGSSCIYPRNCVQPMQEEALLSGALEQSNEPYALAKIAGIKLCEAYHNQHGFEFVAVMPPNLYGPNDNFEPETSHVLPGLMLRMHKAKLNSESTFTVWGTGTPLREFMHSDDAARVCLELMNSDATGIFNAGSNEEVSIKQLAEMIASIIGFEGSLIFDTSMPDGHPRKLMDSSKIRDFVSKPSISLKEGLAKTYEELLSNYQR